MNQRSKINLFITKTACVAALFGVFALAGCASHAPLKTENLFCDEVACAAEEVADYDALVLKSGDAEIYGQILIPSSKFTGKRPCVLMFHGFAGFGRFDDVGQALCRAGCVVVIPHHRGAWGSRGKYLISNCVQDAVALVKYVKTPAFQEKYRIDTEAVFLVGHSMGGNTVLNAAVEVPGVRGIVMIAPCDIGNMFKSMSKEQMRLFMVDNGLEVLHTAGFDAVYGDLAAHADQYAFPEAAAKLKNIDLFLAIGEWDSCISNDLLEKFYAAARENNSIKLSVCKSYKARHGLMGARTLLSRDIADFINKSLAE